MDKNVQVISNFKGERNSRIATLKGYGTIERITNPIGLLIPLHLGKIKVGSSGINYPITLNPSKPHPNKAHENNIPNSKQYTIYRNENKY